MNNQNKVLTVLLTGLSTFVVSTVGLTIKGYYNDYAIRMRRKETEKIVCEKVNKQLKERESSDIKETYNCDQFS